MFTRNGTAKGQIVAEQDAFCVIACIVYAQLLSEHKIVAQNKNTIALLRDRSTGRRIRTTRSDNKFVPANQIVRTNKIDPDCSDRYITVTFFEVIETIGRLSDRYIVVTFFEVCKYRTVSDRYITVTFFEV